MSLLDCLELEIGFKDLSLLTINELKLSAGSSYPLVGTNGCGKSTLLKTLAGFIAPISGKITYDNLPHTKSSNLDNMSYLPEHSPLFDKLTVIEHLQLITTKEVIQTKEYLLKHFDLACLKNKFPHQLSAGQQRCLSLACLLLRQPKVLLLDEPTKELDEDHRAVFHRLIYDACQKGAACIFSTHLPEDCKSYRKLLTIKDKQLLIKANQMVPTGADLEDFVPVHA